MDNKQTEEALKKIVGGLKEMTNKNSNVKPGTSGLSKETTISDLMANLSITKETDHQFEEFKERAKLIEEGYLKAQEELNEARRKIDELESKEEIGVHNSITYSSELGTSVMEKLTEVLDKQSITLPSTQPTFKGDIKEDVDEFLFVTQANFE